MHYIVGTSFRITPNPKNVIRDRRFLPQQNYTLIQILKKEDKVTYVFNGGGQKITIDFNSCREGDNFISKLRNENIPNYDAQAVPVVDNVAD